ncbi:VanW family protein [Cellulomonas soli]
MSSPAVDAVVSMPEGETETEAESAAESAPEVEPEVVAETASEAAPEPEPEAEAAPEPEIEPEIEQRPASPIVPVAAASAPVDPPFAATGSAPASPAPVTSPFTPTTAPDAAGAAAPAGPSSPLDVFDDEPTVRRWPRRLLVALGVVLVLGGAYVGASYALADRVPRGTTVAGVDIGGLSADAAVARLTEELDGPATEPITVVAKDVQAELDPATAGLTFDPQATVDTLTGLNLARPSVLWDHLVGVGARTPVTQVDADALSSALTSLTTSLSLAPVDGAIVFADGAPHATEAVAGWEVDVEAAAATVEESWLVGERPLPLPTLEVEPAITQEATDAALKDARAVTAAPVGVTVADRMATLSPQVLAAAASYVPQDGELVLTMDGQALQSQVLEQLPDLLTQASDAHFEFQADAPVIVPGVPGTALDPAALATAVAQAVHASVRTAAVTLVESDPTESTAELEALGIKEIVSEFSTPLTAEQRRTVNITNGASKISGTLVRPDETFSLTQALGPIDGEHGFVQAGAIVSGEHVDAWGGGLSQISTTTYNAAYFAGFEDVEHQPHSEWFTRYPEGRESTLFTGTIDLKWKNNTPYGALVQAWVADGRVYVRIWGTKYWTVESETSGRSGVVAPTTVYSQSPTCEASNAGNPGFTVTVTRRTYLEGVLKETDANTWRYKPQNKVICGAAPTTPTP